MKDLKAVNEGLARDNRNQAEQIENLHGEIDGLNDDLAAFQEGAVDFERMLDEKDHIIDQMTDNIEDLEAEKKDLSKYVILYRNIADECKAANEKLRNAEIEIGDLKNNLYNLS
jgi:chromosome segregation ATPase